VIGNFAAGQNLDSLRSSHPVEVAAYSPAEISQIFDAISYSKGASVIRMLNAYLGAEVFGQGVRNYLKEHMYGNATTVDLWRSLSDASGQDIQSIMHEWIQSVGFPFVSIDNVQTCQDSSSVTLILSQERFLATGDLTDEERLQSPVWQIPLTVATHEGEYSFLLKEKSSTITFPFKISPKSFWKLNSNCNGFYRILLSKSQIEMLGQVMLNYPSALTDADKIGLISDAFALSKAGLCCTTIALSLFQYYKYEQSPVYFMSDLGFYKRF
jgi:aminopeptidase 2